MAGPKARPVEDRFDGYLIKAGDDECWGWTGPTNGHGYPTIGRGGHGGGQVSARLLAYRLTFDKEPTGEIITSCGSAICLNPHHLLLREKKPALTVRRRFEEKVRQGTPDECWLWTGSTTNGYGFLSMGRKRGPAPAHRIAWELAKGPIPEGLLVRQRCGNRLCCNPAHLFLAVNSQDDPVASARAIEHWLRFRS